MTIPTKYALDSDVFMQAARTFYSFEIAPGFWQALVRHSQAGNIISIDRVQDELEKGKDALKDWAKGDFASWFDSTDRLDVLDAYADLMNWAVGQTSFTDSARSEFAEDDNADSWLVAYVIAESKAGNNLVLVTQEKFDPNIKKRIKIPNVCQAFNVKQIDLFQLLRVLKIQWT